MRHTDHPRPWPEIRALLTAPEIAALTAHARETGFDIAEAEPADVERLYQEWRERNAEPS